MRLPAVKSGVYVLFDKDEVVYVGESENIYKRVGQHISEGVKEFDSFDVYETPSRKRLEGFLIKTFRPKYNIAPGELYWPKEYYDEYTFTMPGIEEVVKCFEAEAVSVAEIEECSGIYCNRKTVMTAIKNHFEEIPAWSEGGKWYIDYKWYKNNAKKIRQYIQEADEEERKKRIERMKREIELEEGTR